MALDSLSVTCVDVCVQVRGGLTFREGHYICEAVYETGCLVALDIMVRLVFALASLSLTHVLFCRRSTRLLQTRNRSGRPSRSDAPSRGQPLVCITSLFYTLHMAERRVFRRDSSLSKHFLYNIGRSHFSKQCSAIWKYRTCFVLSLSLHLLRILAEYVETRLSKRRRRMSLQYVLNCHGYPSDSTEAPN